MDDFWSLKAVTFSCFSPYHLSQVVTTLLLYLGAISFILSLFTYLAWQSLSGNTVNGSRTQCIKSLFCLYSSKLDRIDRLILIQLSFSKIWTFKSNILFSISRQVFPLSDVSVYHLDWVYSFIFCRFCNLVTLHVYYSFQSE